MGYKVLRKLYNERNFEELRSKCAENLFDHLCIVIKHNDMELMYTILPHPSEQENVNIVPIMKKLCAKLIYDGRVDLLTDMKLRGFHIYHSPNRHTIVKERIDMFEFLEGLPQFKIDYWIRIAIREDSVFFITTFIQKGYLQTYVQKFGVRRLLNLIASKDAIKVLKLLDEMKIIKTNAVYDLIMKSTSYNGSLFLFKMTVGLVAPLLDPKLIRDLVSECLDEVNKRIGRFESRPVFSESSDDESETHQKVDGNLLSKMYTCRCILENIETYIYLWKRCDEVKDEIICIRSLLVRSGFPYREYIVKIGSSNPSTELDTFSIPSMICFLRISVEYTTRLITSFSLWSRRK
jgi:hypothetical protein